MTDRQPSFVERGGLWVAVQAWVMLLAAVIPVWTHRGSLIPQLPLQWLGVLIVAIGIVFVAAGAKALGSALTPYPEPRRQAGLRTHGIYRLVRHPIYAGIVIGALGWTIWCLSGIGLLYWFALLVFFDRKSAQEEQRLRRVYPEYADYQRRVKRLLPWVY